MAALMGFPAALQVSGELTHAGTSELATAIRAAQHSRRAAVVGSTHGTWQAKSSMPTCRAAFAIFGKRCVFLSWLINASANSANRQQCASHSRMVDRMVEPKENTCEWAVRRQDALPERVPRMSKPLRTRVEIKQQQ